MGTNYKGSKEEIRALDTYIKLVRATESLGSRIYRSPHLDGLTYSQFGVLEALLHLGPLCQRELGSKILKSSGNITMVIDNLEKRDLVVRQRDQKDRRYVTIHLTSEGKQLIEKVLPAHVACITQELNRLSPHELEQMAGLLRKLGKGEDKQSFSNAS